MTTKSTAMSPVNSASDFDYDTFVNVDAETRFSTYNSSKSFFTERGFLFSMDDANPMIPVTPRFLEYLIIWSFASF
jgi:hypothetical protein